MWKLAANLLFISLLIFGCGRQDNQYIYWVNSFTVECEGVAITECLQVQKGEQLQDDQWDNFYSFIDGFEYEPGFIYKLVVEENELDPESIPADASSVTYTLIEELEKRPDEKFQLNANWRAVSIERETIDPNIESQGGRIPQLEFQVVERKFYGNDGCNNIFGDIAELSDANISFGLMAGTMMACPGDVSDRFRSALEKTISYKIQGNDLTFLDKAGNNLIVFEKVY